MSPFKKGDKVVAIDAIGSVKVGYTGTVVVGKEGAQRITWVIFDQMGPEPVRIRGTRLRKEA